MTTICVRVFNRCWHLSLPPNLPLTPTPTLFSVSSTAFIYIDTISQCRGYRVVVGGGNSTRLAPRQVMPKPTHFHGVQMLGCLEDGGGGGGVSFLWTLFPTATCFVQHCRYVLFFQGRYPCDIYSVAFAAIAIALNDRVSGSCFWL